MNNFKRELSVIIPTYNEQGTIKELVERICASMVKKNFLYEIIIIDDNSTDNTSSILKSLYEDNPIKYFRKVGKRGKAYSLIEGFLHAKFDNVGFIDADLQYDPEELVQMAMKLQDFDVVVANRKKYQDSFIRKGLSRAFRTCFGRLMFGLNSDIQSGLKVFKKEVIDFVNFTPNSSWSFDLEFLRNASEAGFRIGNHDIVFTKRALGKSKIGIIQTSAELALSSIALRLTPVLPKKIKPISNISMKGAGTRYKKKEFVTHSTLNHRNSAIDTFTGFQKFAIAFAAEIFIMGLILKTMLTLGIFIGILSFIYFLDTIFNFFIVFKSLGKHREISVSKEEIDSLNDSKLPVYSILCPLYKEAHIIPQFIRNIEAISWPKNKLDVLLLLEEDDKESILKAKKMDLPKYVRVIIVPNSQPKTKPKACNYGLSFAKGEFLVIYDAEDKPDTLQLKKAFITFKNLPRHIVCLQAKLNYYNSNQNLLTRFFTAEYSLWFDVTLTGFQSIDTSIPLGGTSNHFRTSDIIKLQGWDPFNVTEDADLGMRLFKAGYKTAIIDSVTLEEANSQWGNWIRQRSRWIKGYMQTYLVHTRNSLAFAKEHRVHFFLFHLIIGGKIAFILINPFLWIATISYFTLYSIVGPAIESLYPAVIFYMAAFSLIFGNFLFMYYYMIGVMKREQFSLVKYTFLIPFYWLMISLSGFVALKQLLLKPFYWEKTVHGLHITQKSKFTPKLENESEFKIPKIILIPVKYGMSLFA